MDWKFYDIRAVGRDWQGIDDRPAPIGVDHPLKAHCRSPFVRPCWGDRGGHRVVTSGPRRFSSWWRSPCLQTAACPPRTIPARCSRW